MFHQPDGLVIDLVLSEGKIKVFLTVRKGSGLRSLAIMDPPVSTTQVRNVHEQKLFRLEVLRWFPFCGDCSILSFSSRRASLCKLQQGSAMIVDKEQGLNVQRGFWKIKE